MMQTQDGAKGVGDRGWHPLQLVNKCSSTTIYDHRLCRTCTLGMQQPCQRDGHFTPRRRSQNVQQIQQLINRHAQRLHEPCPRVRLDEPAPIIRRQNSGQELPRVERGEPCSRQRPTAGQGHRSGLRDSQLRTQYVTHPKSGFVCINDKSGSLARQSDPGGHCNNATFFRAVPSNQQQRIFFENIGETAPDTTLLAGLCSAPRKGSPTRNSSRRKPVAAHTRTPPHQSLQQTMNQFNLLGT
mmetsp:Transcript_7782/g.21316  ORF Transcript_7782/g.21316 Transcript_7782/m.21316 type:complete len:241 (+) Transcript_7782:465-1187(+)